MKLLGTGNSKTIKGEAKGWTTYVMYLSPHKQNSKGKNLCSKASAGCAEACLFTAGRGAMKKIQDARRAKTELFISDRKQFMSKLIEEINLAVRRHNRTDTQFCIRLNGTSDIPWEHIKVDGKNIFEIFSDVQFYDYTKDTKRITKNNNNNYHLTFSRSEDNQVDTEFILASSENVAVVFNTLPTTYRGYKVVNGDEDDLRFLDEKGVVVGLKAKGGARKDTTGFVI